MIGIAGTAAALTALLGAAVLVAIVAERLRVPHAVALVAFGTALAAVRPVDLPFHFGDTLLFVFLPPLIFEAAWNIDPAVLRRVAGRVAVLAFPGVVAVVAAIAAAVAWSGALAPAPALLLAVIVAPTDPVAVIALFRRLHVPADLHAIVEGESIANDGVAIALFGIALALASGGAAQAPAAATFHFVLAVLGGCAIGAAAALLLTVITGRTADPALAVTATIVLAFLSYLAAAGLGLSGVFATATAAIVLRNAGRFAARDEVVVQIDAFWSAIAFVANAFVFLLTGLSLQLGRIGHEPVLVAVTVAAVILSRVVLAAVVIRQPAWRIAVALAGMRGGLSLALALAIPDAVAGRSQIIDAVFGVVFFTLVVQGLALAPAMRRLRL
jgi:CPA1 family monovalent cation:H+ antiporter